MLIIVLILLAIVGAWRDSARFIMEGTWQKSITNFPYWTWGYKYNLDAFHFSGGLRVVIILLAFYFGVVIDELWHIVPAWWFLFYVRNIFMHVIWRTKGNKQRRYLNPFYDIYQIIYKFFIRRRDV